MNNHKILLKLRKLRMIFFYYLFRERGLKYFIYLITNVSCIYIHILSSTYFLLYITFHLYQYSLYFYSHTLISLSFCCVRSLSKSKECVLSNSPSINNSNICSSWCFFVAINVFSPSRPGVIYHKTLDTPLLFGSMISQT